MKRDTAVLFICLMLLAASGPAEERKQQESQNAERQALERRQWELKQAFDVPPEGTTGNRQASATLPLEEILRLYKENETRRDTVKVQPPVAATLDAAVFSARLLERAADVSARFEITVLEDDLWVRVPLIEASPSMSVASLADTLADDP